LVGEKMDISNRALGLLLVAAIVISIGGTVISLNNLDGFSTTGYATALDNGTVSLSVATSLSIVLDNDAIDFGTCTLPGGVSLDVDSDLNGSALNNSKCDAASSWGTAGEFLTVRNNGNVDANVTITTNTTALNFFGQDASSWIAYKGDVTGANGGCSSGLVSTYTNLTTAAEYIFCNVLDADLVDNSANLTIKAHMSAAAVSGNIMQVKFTANAI
jgi:hypothetical protein